MRKLHLYIFLFVGLFASVPSYAQKDKQEQLEEKRRAILAEIKQINSLLSKTKKQEKSVLTQVNDINKRISIGENLIKVTNQQTNALTQNINANLNKITALREELKVMKADYAAMIQKSYKSKSQQSRIMFLLSSESFFQAYKRLQYMKQYAKFRKKQGEGIRQKTEEVQVLNAGLITQKKKKEQLIKENEKARDELNKEKKQQVELVASLKKDESKYVGQIKDKQKQTDAIEREIDALIRAAIAEANKKANANKTITTTKTTSTGFALTPEAKALAVSFASNKGKLPWPVAKGVVVKSYGKHQHPQFPNVTTNSNGVEIATDDNATARAVFNGEVMQIQKIKGANQAIYIQHGDYITVYSNLKNLQVKKGDKVTTNQTLGTVSVNPSEGKTILKFLIYQNTNKMNPADWILRM